MQDKEDELRKTAIQEKGEAESARVEFREFHSFTEGLLAQGTPLEIAGTHKMVKSVIYFSFRGGVADLPTFRYSLLCFCEYLLIQVQARNETLEKLQFAKQSSVSKVFKFSAANVDEVKKAISTLGSVVSQ